MLGTHYLLLLKCDGADDDDVGDAFLIHFDSPLRGAWFFMLHVSHALHSTFDFQLLLLRHLPFYLFSF